MKLYIAHNFAARHDLRRSVVPLLQSMGHEVTARWILEPDHDRQGGVIESVKDLEDLFHSDALLLFTDNAGPRPGRGKFVELGYALALKKKIFLLPGNPEECVFYQLPFDYVKRIESLEEIQ